MSSLQLLRLVVSVVFIACSAVLLTILVSKIAHRTAMNRHRRRRTAYLAMLSNHLTGSDRRVTMGHRVAQDRAFLEAVIDLRNTLKGRESDDLADIVDRYGITTIQTKKLRRHNRRGTRLRAAVALAELGEESSAISLQKYLRDPEPEIRIQCARGLARMKWTPAIELILDRLNDETPWVRSRFADTLVSFGDAATWPLIAYVRVNHRFEEAGPALAIRTLGTIGDHTAVPAVLDVLEEANSAEIQLAAVETLGTIGGRVATDPLLKALTSEDWRLRAKSATALASTHSHTVVPFLSDGLNDESWWVRTNAARSLGELPGGVDALYAATAGDDSYARDAAAEVLADRGAVIDSRQRIESGTADARDFDLVTLVDGTRVVTL